MSSSKDMIHVLRLACLIHVLDFNILKALGLRSRLMPTRFQKISVIRARQLYHASSQQRNVFNW